MHETYQGLLFLAAFLGAVLYHAIGVYSANCASYDDEDDCEATSGCGWTDSSGCYCTSNVTMDICFALDSSGSIGSDYFEIELDWLSDFVQSSLSASARVGIIDFSTNSYMIMNFSDSENYDSAGLADFIENDIEYYGSFTNTVAAIKQALVMFENESDDKTTKVFVIMTDGNPKLPSGGDTDVCAWASDLKGDDISTYILGVGDNWNPDNVDCLVDDADTDIIYVTSFNYTEFDKILPQLTDITCPVSYEVTITEVKVESDDTDGPTVPFIEIYNPSNDITLTELTFSGVVSGTVTNDDSLTLPQGYYLVLYDATYSTGGTNVTCEECVCDHYAGGDWCTTAVYIGCDGSTEHPCSFSSSYSNSDWTLTVTDNSVDGGDELDTVTRDSTFPDLSSLLGYSYELKNKGYDNDAGSNWQASCNIYGSPGDAPLDTCDTICTKDLCEANGATNVDVDSNGEDCDCDGANHYYSDGCSCVLVPPPSNCTVLWRKNGTYRDYKFKWERADTDDDHQYRLGYYVDGSLQYVTLYPRYKVVTDFDYKRGADVTAGQVQTYMQNTYSQKINCTSYTRSPTTAPTGVPSGNPTPGPTGVPTPAPTYYDPFLYLGGDICLEERCGCDGDDFTDRDCEGDDIYAQWNEGTTEYVTIEQQDQEFPYPTLVYWEIEYMGATDTDNATVYQNENSNSRLLRRTRAMRRILSDKLGRDVSMDEIEYISGGRRSLFQATTTNTPNTTFDADASNDFTPSSGFINVSAIYSDAAQTTVSGNYARLTITVNDDVSDSGSSYELFLLTLKNCSTEYYEAPYDNCDLVYPSSMYIFLDNSGAASNSSVTEEEMPAWLWWVIVALVIFLFVLAWLVYRYWWKNKQTGSALAETQDELDQAIEEADLGFGHDLGQGDVGFNPLATGVPGSMRPADAVGTNLANRQNEMVNDKADVAVERFKAKEQFGQVQPQRRGNDLAQPLLN